MYFWPTVFLTCLTVLGGGYWLAARAGFARQARLGVVVLVTIAFWAFLFRAFSIAEGSKAGAQVATVATTLIIVLISIPIVLYRWLVAVLPIRRWRRLSVAATAAALAGVAIAASRTMARPDPSPGAATFYVAVFVVVWSLAVSAVPIAVLRAALALFTRVRARRREPAPENAEVAVTRRQLVEGLGGCAVLTLTGTSLAWGAARGRFDVRLEEIAVKIPGLPRALDGYTIAQISDIHAGPLLDEAVLARGLSLLGRARPDLVVVTGDIVDDDARFSPRIARALADLRARDGVFGILGNHDYYAGFTRVRAAMSAAGVRMLVNDGLLIRPGERGGFALLGVDDAWAHRAGGAGPDLDAAMRAVGTDAPRVLLSHHPDTVDGFAGRVALQLSGHTHGGQVNPGFAAAGLVTPYVSGRYDVRGTTLYVNRGLGTTGLPSRVGAAPEITKIVLVSA